MFSHFRPAGIAEFAVNDKPAEAVQIDGRIRTGLFSRGLTRMVRKFGAHDRYFLSGLGLPVKCGKRERACANRASRRRMRMSARGPKLPLPPPGASGMPGSMADRAGSSAARKSRADENRGRQSIVRSAPRKLPHRLASEDWNSNSSRSRRRKMETEIPRSCECALRGRRLIDQIIRARVQLRHRRGGKYGLHPGNRRIPCVGKKSVNIKIDAALDPRIAATAGMFDEFPRRMHMPRAKSIDRGLLRRLFLKPECCGLGATRRHRRAARAPRRRRTGAQPAGATRRPCRNPRATRGTPLTRDSNSRCVMLVSHRTRLDTIIATISSKICQS